MSRGDLNAAGRRSGLVGAAAGYRVRRCGRCLVVADPLVPPGDVVLLGVTARAVEGDEFAADLLAVRAATAGHLVAGDVHLPPVAGPADPAWCSRMADREAFGGQIVT